MVEYELLLTKANKIKSYLATLATMVETDANEVIGVQQALIQKTPVIETDSTIMLKNKVDSTTTQAKNRANEFITTAKKLENYRQTRFVRNMWEILKYKLKDEQMIWSFFIRYQKELSNVCIDLYLRSAEHGLLKGMNNVIKLLYDFFPLPFRA